jgi:hypothetical protein
MASDDDEPLSFDEEELDNLIEEHNNNAKLDQNEIVPEEDVDEENVENNTIPKRDEDDDDILNPTTGNFKHHIFAHYQTFLLQ